MWDICTNKNIRTTGLNKKRKNRWALEDQEGMGRTKNSDINLPEKKNGSPRESWYCLAIRKSTMCLSHRVPQDLFLRGTSRSLTRKVTGLNSYFPTHSITFHLLQVKLMWMFCEQKHYSRELYIIFYIIFEYIILIIFNILYIN